MTIKISRYGVDSSGQWHYCVGYSYSLRNQALSISLVKGAVLLQYTSFNFSIGPAYNDSSSTIKIIVEDLSTSCAMMIWVVLGTHFLWEVSQA